MGEPLSEFAKKQLLAALALEASKPKKIKKINSDKLYNVEEILQAGDEFWKEQDKQHVLPV